MKIFTSKNLKIALSVMIFSITTVSSFGEWAGEKDHPDWQDRNKLISNDCVHDGNDDHPNH